MRAVRGGDKSHARGALKMMVLKQIWMLNLVMPRQARSQHKKRFRQARSNLTRLSGGAFIVAVVAVLVVLADVESHLEITSLTRVGVVISYALALSTIHFLATHLVVSLMCSASSATTFSKHGQTSRARSAARSVNP